MAASQRPTAGSLPRQTGFRATDNPEIDEDHALPRWAERAPHCDTPLDVAWREAKSVPFGTFNSRYLRYHYESDRLLLAVKTHNGRESVTILKTVLEPEWYEDKPGVRRAVAAIRRERGGR